MRIRIVSYNVHSFRAGVDAVAAVLREADPDVVCVQECGPKSLLRALAADLGMEWASSHRSFNRVRNAVLHRPEWRSSAVTVRDLSHDGRTLRRGLIVVRLRRAGVRLTAGCFHLGLAPAERERHARELTDLLAGIEGPVVLAGDLNEEPGEPAARWIAERYYDAFARAGDGPGATFPSRAPTARIDYVFVSEHLRPLSAWTVGGPAGRDASDHRPVVADVEAPP
ncbi:MAG TPA: endonuclease/exonuclease/phosphatase family protein [Actinomycetota bacterium]|nr:endonuclease/exonuclease/phosphatase family protein [Actinomycetota bacterium]